jgi:hypothetical protein
MAVHVAPERADCVEISTSVGSDEVVAVSALDDERIPLGHLREGVPHHTAIELFERHNKS